MDRMHSSRFFFRDKCLFFDHGSFSSLINIGTIDTKLHKHTHTDTVRSNTMKYKKPAYERSMGPFKYRPTPYMRSASPTHPVVQNIVAVMNTKKRIDLASVCAHFPMNEFKQVIFAAASCHLDENSTILLYSTGQYVTVGGRTYHEILFYAHAHMQLVGNICEKKYRRDPDTGEYVEITFIPMHRRFKMMPIKIANIVGETMCDDGEIHVNDVYEHNRLVSDYAPDTFPAVRLMNPRWGCSVSGFGSGYRLYLGMTNTDTDRDSFDEISRIFDKAKIHKTIRTAIERRQWAVRMGLSSYPKMSTKKLKALIDRYEQTKIDPQKKKKRAAEEEKTVPNMHVYRATKFEKRLQDYFAYAQGTDVDHTKHHPTLSKLAKEYPDEELFDCYTPNTFHWTSARMLAMSGFK